MMNVYAKPENATLVAQLKQELQSLKLKYQVPEAR